MLQCNFCHNKFNTVSSLNNHKKTAKYCLEKQQKQVLFQCNLCDKSFSSKYGMSKHVMVCQETYEVIQNKIEKRHIDEVDELKQQIRELQDKLENIAIKAVQRPTNTTNMNKTNINNFIQNMKPVTNDHLLDHVGNLTIEHVQKGASGYAEYALEYPLKNRVICVDYSRRKIKFKDCDGNVITDHEMERLAPLVFDSIKDKSSELVFSKNSEVNNKDMDSNMFERLAILFNTNSDVKRGSEGVKSDFFNDFVKHVCSASLKDV